MFKVKKKLFLTLPTIFFGCAGPFRELRFVCNQGCWAIKGSICVHYFQFRPVIQEMLEDFPIFNSESHFAQQTRIVYAIR